VYYFVIAQDGSRYGPADVDTLVSWAREGRLVGDTQLIERGTERTVRACELPALRAVTGGNPPQSHVSSIKIERAYESPTMTQPGRSYDAGQANGAPPPPTMPHQMHYAQDRRAKGHTKFGTAPGDEYLSHRNRVVAGLLGIFLGTFGIHRFYLGYHGIGVLQLILGIASCGVSGIWGLVEGIICLTGGMTDAEGRELRS